MSAIDIGAAAISRAYGVSLGTAISVDNPANLSGIITSVSVWAKTTIAGLRVGTFYLVSGTTYKCRDSAALGAVNTGSIQTFNGLSIQVVQGDLIGCYMSSGYIMLDGSGFGGVMNNGSEYIDPEDSASFSLSAGYAMSLYGVGAEVALGNASFLLRMI